MKDQPLPAYRPVVAALARWYIPRFVRKAFHAVRLDAQSAIPPAALPREWHYSVATRFGWPAKTQPRYGRYFYAREKSLTGA